MKLPRLLSLGMMVAGAAAALGPLQRRRTWDGVNRTVTIALDYDDTVEAAVRAGMPPGDLLHQLWHAGASHLAIPEDSLARLQAQGRLGLAIPLQPLADAPPLGGWTYLAAHEAGLLPRLQIELAARLPQLAARLVEDRGRSLLAIGGPVAAVQHVGLGFDTALARLAREAGLQPLPRPASYPWPTATTIERTLAQAAEVGGSGHPAEGPAIVAFQGQGDPEHPGDLVLGHEMQIRDTIAAMQRHRVAFAYFVESRHQRGDWFVAKSLAPAVVLAHEFTPANLVLEDMHSAAHRWGLLAREKGIRLCLLRLFKVVHATTPLDCVDYVAAVANVLVNREGMSLNNRPDFRPARVHHRHGHGHHHHDHAHHSHEHHDPNHDHAHDNHEHHGHAHSSPAGTESETSPADAVPTLPVRNTQSLPHLPRDDRALALVSLVPAAAGAIALSEFLRLPAGAEAALALAGLGAPLLIGWLDRPTTDIEAAFRPSYAPKLIALGITALSPLAAGLALRNGVPGLAQALVIQASAAMGLAATVAEHEYALRVEEVKTAGLDWIVPLGGALAMAIARPDQDSSRAARRSLLAGGLSLAGLLLARSPAVPGDLLSAWDQEHSAQHTHHLSRMQAAIGDLKMGMSPRPLRKWTLWALAAQTATVALPPGPLARLSSVLATAGNVAFLAGFRQAGRPIVRTLADRVPGVQP